MDDSGEPFDVLDCGDDLVDFRMRNLLEWYWLTDDGPAAERAARRVPGGLSVESDQGDRPT